MAKLLRVAAVSLAAVRVKRSIGKALTQAALLALALGLGLAGAGFLVSALWIWLAAASTPLVASLAIGAGLVIAALAVALAASIIRNRKPESPINLAPAATLSQMEIPHLSGRTVATSAVVLAGIGYAIGRGLARK